MPKSPTSKRRYHRLTVAEWVRCINLYERGEANGSDLARLFNVHSNTFYNYMKSHGIVKACRVDEVLVDLMPALDARNREKVLQNAGSKNGRPDRLASHRDAMADVLGEFLKNILESDRAGELSEFGVVSGLISRRSYKPKVA